MQSAFENKLPLSKCGDIEQGLQCLKPCSLFRLCFVERGWWLDLRLVVTGIMCEVFSRWLGHTG